MDLPGSTLADVERHAESPVASWTRRGVLALVTALVLAGAGGFLGVRTAVRSTSAGGWELSLRYASTARAGLDVPWEVTVRRPGGLPDEVVLAVTGSYLDIYESQGFSPEPTDATRDGRLLYLTFAAPPGDTLVVAYDAYIQPSSQTGRDGTLSVIEDGAPVATVEFSTRLLP